MGKKRFFPLNSAIVLEISGADYLRYLNARLTNDFRALSGNQGIYAAALSSSGKTEGLFAAYKWGEESCILISDGGEREGVISAFKRFIVADRVNVKDLTGETLLYHLVAEGSSEKEVVDELESVMIPSKNELACSQGNNLLILARRKRGPAAGLDILINRSLKEKLTAFLDGWQAEPLSGEEITLNRILAGLPSFPEDLNERSVFSAFDWLNAVSNSKGCYVGQEVIEKSTTFAKLPRVLKRIKLEGRVTGSQVKSGEVEIGRITSLAYDGESGNTLCFALMKNDESLLSSGIFVDGVRGMIF